jgi:glycosyltransferase involved in cell wall biosynthesis
LGTCLNINYFEPLDADDLAEVLLTVWKNNDLRQAQAEHNSNGIYNYTWLNAAHKYDQFFNSIMKE